ncbi:SdiA-regulated domain-containing protein [Burkholderiaceae bacterium UC74_6]
MKKTRLIQPLLLALAAALSCGAAQAQSSLNLGNYSVSATYALDRLNGTSGGISGLEASAVTYARDRNSLFFVGDEGTGVVEISLTGQTLGHMNFDWTSTGSAKHDTESLTYLGNGQLVVGEERLYDAYKFSYVNGGSAKLVNAGVSISNDNVGNDGMEGLSYDPRNGGSFVAVKQDVPEDVKAGTLSFGASLSGTANMSTLFDPTKLGLSTLSDVAVLSTVDAFAGTAVADHLLFLSLGSRMLVEADRNGNVISSFDLSNVVPHNGIEGVTIDEKGTIYLVAEQAQDGSISADLAQSQLIVLSPTAAVPEPASATLMMIGALSLLSLARRRCQQR